MVVILWLAQVVKHCLNIQQDVKVDMVLIMKILKLKMKIDTDYLQDWKTPELIDQITEFEISEPKVPFIPEIDEPLHNLSQNYYKYKNVLTKWEELKMLPQKMN
jgi:hypothetical protein